jgi:hypothetical protein
MKRIIKEYYNKYYSVYYNVLLRTLWGVPRVAQQKLLWGNPGVPIEGGFAPRGAKRPYR